MVKPDDPEHMRELDKIAQEKFNKTFEECDPHERIQVQCLHGVEAQEPSSAAAGSALALAVRHEQSTAGHAECGTAATIFCYPLT